MEESANLDRVWGGWCWGYSSVLSHSNLTSKKLISRWEGNLLKNFVILGEWSQLEVYFILTLIHIMSVGVFLRVKPVKNTPPGMLMRYLPIYSLPVPAFASGTTSAIGLFGALSANNRARLTWLDERSCFVIPGAHGNRTWPWTFGTYSVTILS